MSSTAQESQQPRMDGANNAFGSLVRTREGFEEEDEEEGAEDGVLFLVNKGGFPLDDFTYERMWNRAAKFHPEGFNAFNKIRGKKKLPEVPIPQAPLPLSSNMTVPQKLDIVQKYICDLQYNHTGTQFFEIRKNRPLSGLMDTAKDMIKEALPIKCLEAVILALYLTLGIPGLDRFPVSFRSKFNGDIHCHVVLGVYYNGLYGALGMSRRQDLMNKPLKFKSLSAMVLDYKQAYKNYMHQLKRVAIGVPVPHDLHSFEHIEWRGLVMPSIIKMSQEEMCKDLDKYAREIRAQIKTIVTSDGSHQGMKRSTPGLRPIDPTPTRTKHRAHSKTKKKSAKGKKERPKPAEVTESGSSSEGEDPPQPATSSYQIRI